MSLINTISGDKGLRKTCFGPGHSVLGEKSPLNTHAPSQSINTESPHCDGSSSLYSVVKYEFFPEPFRTNEHSRDSSSLILSTMKIHLAVDFPGIWSSDGKTTSTGTVNTDEIIVLFYNFIATETCPTCWG